MKRYQAYYHVLQLVLFMSIIVVGNEKRSELKVLTWGLGYLLTYIMEFKKEKESIPPVANERQSVLEDNNVIVTVSQKTIDSLSDSLVIVHSDEETISQSPIQPVSSNNIVV